MQNAKCSTYYGIVVVVGGGLRELPASTSTVPVDPSISIRKLMREGERIHTFTQPSLSLSLG
jgi:hypothetical protein